MKPAIEQIFGLMMQQTKTDCIETFSRIDERFLKTGFQKRIYQAMSELIKQKKEIDLMTITLQFKENGWFDQKVIVQISKLTSEAYSITSILRLSSLFEQCIQEVVFEKALSIRNQIDVLLESENLTMTKFHEIIQSGNDVKFDHKKDKSNVDVIFDVVQDHINAKQGIVCGTEIGYSFLNEVVLLEPVDVMVVGARPAMGKTAFGVNTLVKMVLQGKKVAFFALEMTKKQMIRRILSNISGIDSNKIKFGNCSAEEMNRIYGFQGMESIWNNIFIFEGSHSINDIASEMNRLKREHQIDLFFVDYIQKIQPKSSRSRYEVVSEISNGLKLICQNLQIPCLALAQLSRDSSKTGKRPSLPDLKESGEIEQDASIVAFLHRPEYFGETETYNGNDSTNVCELIIAKNREGEIGIWEMIVDLKTSKFTS
jgi:replicative DNA helicase